MRKLRYLVLIVSISYCSFATNKPTNFDLAFQAECYIANNQFDKAIEAYEQLFKLYKSNSYTDLHNACLCYINLNKYKEAIQLSKKLVLNGYILEDFENENFNALKTTSDWDKFVKESYPDLRIEYNKSIDTVYRNKIFQTIRNDQKVSISYNEQISDSVYYWQGVALIKLFNQHGFPPCFNQKDTLFYKLNGVFRHYFGLEHRYNSMTLKESIYKHMDFEENNLENQLLKAIQTKYLHPIYLLKVYNYSEQGNKYGSIMVKVYLREEKLKLYQIDTVVLQKANLNRGRVGLPVLTADIIDNLLKKAQSNFPYKAIIEAYKNCVSCKDGNDYAQVFLTVLNNSQASLTSGFILRSIPEINGWFLVDDKLFRKNDSDNITPQ